MIKFKVQIYNYLADTGILLYNISKTYEKATGVVLNLKGNYYSNDTVIIISLSLDKDEYDVEALKVAVSSNIALCKCATYELKEFCGKVSA